MARKWEYSQLFYQNEPIDMNEMNAHGQEGWELVSHGVVYNVEEEMIAGEEVHYFIFKREIEEE